VAAVEWFAIGGFVASFEAVKVQAQDTEPAIEVKVRADPSQLVILRGIAATMASQCNFDLDEIADVRLAVDEASSLLIVRAQPDSTLQCRFLVAPGTLWVAVTANTTGADAGSRRGFGWHVLNTLVDSIDMTQVPDSDAPAGYVTTIEFTKSALDVDEQAVEGERSL